MIIGLNVAVCLAVLYTMYWELTAVFTFAASTSDKDHFLMTRIQRTSVKFYFVFIGVTAAVILFVVFTDAVEKMILISLVALLFGFLVNAFVYQICFVNDAGLGSVSLKFEMEIPWNEIQSYDWQENVLRITLKRKFLKHRQLKFNDSSATIAVNDRLRKLSDRHEALVSGPHA